MPVLLQLTKKKRSVMLKRNLTKTENFSPAVPFPPIKRLLLPANRGLLPPVLLVALKAPAWWEDQFPVERSVKPGRNRYGSDARTQQW
jgi:hypothetical protein